MVEGLSLPRMLAGTNWFLGFSHTTPAKDKQICALTGSQVADVLVTFVEGGVDAVLGYRPNKQDRRRRRRGGRADRNVPRNLRETAGRRALARRGG